MAKLISLNLEGRAHRELPSGWLDLGKYFGYSVLAATAIVGSENCGGSNPSPTQPTPTDQSPVRSNGQPTGMLPAGTTEKIASLETRANASCKYAAAAGVDYDSMPNTFSTTGGTQHSTLVTGLQNGSSYTLNARCRDAATGATNTTDFPISFGVSSPQPGNGIEFTNSIRDIIDGSVPATGTITINGGLGPRITNGSYTITKDMNLTIGSRTHLIITAPSYTTREGYFNVTARGFEADLGSGRTEFPLNLYHDIPGTFTAAEYAAFCLRRNDHLQRVTSPLHVAVYDAKIYVASNGNLIDKGDFPMRQATKNDLMRALREGLPFWTDNQIYTSSNIDSFIHLQSRGDPLPDVSKGITQPGWIVIFQDSNPPPGYAITRSDSGTDQITWASLGITTAQEITHAGWDADLRESMGYAQIYEIIKDPRYAPYAKVMFSRPPGHMLPDKSPQ